MFIDRFKSENSNIEFCKFINQHPIIISEQEAIDNKKDDVYFLSWVDKNYIYLPWKRAWNENIVEKNSIIIDIDLRKNFKDIYWLDCINDDIITEANNIIENLKYEDRFLSDFDFVIFSWNWIHIWYLWDWQKITFDDYSFWVNRIYNHWNNYWWNKLYNADASCKNIGRIMRFPSSINQKNWAESKILYSWISQWLLVKNLKWFAKKEREDITKENQIKNEKRIQKYIEDQKINKLIYWTWFDEKREKLDFLFKKIDSIPAYIIAEKILPQYPLNKNWKNFNNEKWWFTAYYYIEDMNAICNWWSKHFNWWEDNSCWSPSMLIKNKENYTWAQTIDYFKKTFNIK